MSAQPVLISMPPEVQLDRILYATDFSMASERALPIVSAIARHYHSQVHLAHIYPSAIYPLDVPAARPVDSAAIAEQQMSELVHRPELENLSITTDLEAGDPVEQIDRYVRGHNINLVVIGTHGRTRLTHALLGSVAEELFRTLKCAVLIVGLNLDPRFTSADTIRSILFPTDLSQESKAVFPYLASLAAEFQSEIIVLHVLPEETSANPDARTLAEPLRERMKQMFAGQLSSRTQAKYLVEFGAVVPSILSASDYYQSDLIGMGVREGNQLLTHFRSSAAYRVVVGASCPVLTMRGTL